MRRKARVKEDIEFYSVMRTIRAIEESDVCIVMIDATVGLTAQDINIYHLAEKQKGIVLLVNKWDLIETATKNTKKWRRKSAPSLLRLMTFLLFLLLFYTNKEFIKLLKLH